MPHHLSLLLSELRNAGEIPGTICSRQRVMGSRDADNGYVQAQCAGKTVGLRGARLRLLSRFLVGTSVLDVGFAQRPNRFLTGSQVVGLDLSPMEVKPPYTRHVMGDAMNVDALLPGSQFDTIILGEVIEHLERPYDLLRCIRDHIAPGGRLLLSTPNPLGVPVVLAEYCHLRRFYYSQDHVYYITPRWVWRMLERCGYDVVKTVGCGAMLLGHPVPAPASLSYLVVYVARVVVHPENSIRAV